MWAVLVACAAWLPLTLAFTTGTALATDGADAADVLATPPGGDGR